MLVRAGFEVDVQRAIPRLVTGSCESHLLRVRLPSLLVVALARHAAVSVQNDSAHHRIGAGSVVGLAVAYRRMKPSKYIREPNQTAQRSTTEKGLRESPAAFLALDPLTLRTSGAP